jgi:hypothetical protein
MTPESRREAWRNMYDDRTLREQQLRWSQKLSEFKAKLISPFLSAEERRALGPVQFDCRLAGLGPLDYFAYADETGRPYVAMPALSLLFLEDLCTAYAWLHVSGFSLETVDLYVTMLRYRDASDFAGGRYPSPLTALQVPGAALDDGRVSQLSLRFRNTAVTFILLHELGHVLYGHRGYQGVAKAAARRNEEVADRFALDVLKRVVLKHDTTAIPMGAVLFFQAQAYFQPNRGQGVAEGWVKTDEDWRRYVEEKLTHPLTADRLVRIATALGQWADEVDYPDPAASAAAREILRDIAWKLAGDGSGMTGICSILQSEELQACMSVVARRADPKSPSTLAPSRPGNSTRTLFERWCAKAKGAP